MVWMKDGRVRVYVLGKKVETDGIENGELHKQAYSSLKASKLTFANVFICTKVTVEQLRKPQGYRMDFLKVLVTTQKTQNLRVITWNFPFFIKFIFKDF